jgi:hypothetical protein
MATSHHSQNIAAFSINKPYLLEYSFTVLSFSSGCFAQTIVCDIVLWQMDIRQPANGCLRWPWPPRSETRYAQIIDWGNAPADAHGALVVREKL